jgi:regulator of nonsense transcripts 2
MNCEIADVLAHDFCYMNSKQNRRNLISDILEYRKDYNLLLPYLCRFIATLNRHFKDLGEIL